MLNSKKSFKDNVENGGRSRTKSIYNANHTHALSMNLLIDNDRSPDKLAHFGELKIQHKYSQKENNRETARLGEGTGRKSYRENLQSKSKKKIMTTSTIETERPSSHSVYSKAKKKSSINEEVKDNYSKEEIKNFGKIGINKDELKVILRELKNLEAENENLKKQRTFLFQNGLENKCSVLKALSKEIRFA